MDSSKIFIDTDNEITFILEKILNAKSDRVSLIIPDRASLFSSITALKLIKRVIDKSNKLLVLVTLDDQGAELARKADLLVVSRVGEINEDIWEKAQKEKFKAIKKNIRPHYLPDEAIEDLKNDQRSEKEETEVKEPEYIKELEEQAAEEVDIKDLPEVVESAEEALGPDQSQVPQVRVTIDLKDLQEAEEASLEESEVEEPDVETKAPMSVSNMDFGVDLQDEMPDIVERVEDVVPEHTTEGLLEDSAVAEEVENTEGENYRIRKVAPKSSGISNLSFAVGKDIKREKKK